MTSRLWLKIKALLPFASNVKTRLFSQALSHPLFSPFFLLIPLLPFVYAVGSFFYQSKELDKKGAKAALLWEKNTQRKREKEQEAAFLQQLSQADPLYLSRHVESLSFRQQERIKLQELPIKTEEKRKRLEFLQGEKNTLRFTEKELGRSKKFQEYLLKQKHPVEIDEEDLKKLLCLLEGVAISPYTPRQDRPQFLLEHCTLVRKENPSSEPVFTIEMTLIKRTP